MLWHLFKTDFLSELSSPRYNCSLEKILFVMDNVFYKYIFVSGILGKGKIIYKAIEVSCLINLHFPSNLTFSFRGMLLNVALSFIIQPSSTTDKSVLFSDSGQALLSVLNFVYHYFFKSQLTFWDRRTLSRPWFEFLADKFKKAIAFSIITTLAGIFQIWIEPTSEIRSNSFFEKTSVIRYSIHV